MDLANICNVDKNLLDKKIMELLELDERLPQHYKEDLFKLVFSSGKRIRPIITVLGSYFGEGKCDDIYNLAAIFELIHTASLIHDDIIDKADTRRGTKAIHIKNGVYKSLMLGNYLVALSSKYISKFNFENIYYNNFSITDLCESEINQQALLFNFDITFDKYIEKTKNKTALLIAASLLGGAKLASANTKTLEILYNYGINLGISFQIIDDILDFTQDKAQLGKPNGADLINGNITLPVIFALQDKKIRSEIQNLNEDSSIDQFDYCIDYILNSKAIGKSKEISKKYLRKAEKSIRRLRHPQKSILINILYELEKRTY